MMYEESARPRILIEAIQDMAKDYGLAALISLLIFFITPFWIKWICFNIVALILSADIIANFISLWKPRKRVSPKGKAVFITGCGSGFGKMLAQRLDDLGFYVYAGCHHPESTGAMDLKKSASDRLHIVPIDVTSDESVAKAYNYVVSNLKDNKFWALVNNAGTINGGEILWTNLETIKKVIDTNTLGTIRVTKAFLPLLCSSKGRIITIASVSGRCHTPRMVSYSLSKSAAIFFSDGLRSELNRFGVKVITIEPFIYETKMSNSNLILNSMYKEWENTRSEIKALYPENYWCRYEKITKEFIDTFTNKNIDEVLECIETAILADNPKFSYTLGFKYARITLWFVLKLPKVCIDFALNEYDQNDIINKILRYFSKMFLNVYVK